MRQSTRPARFGLLLIVTAAGLLVAACAPAGAASPASTVAAAETPADASGTPSASPTAAPSAEPSATNTATEPPGGTTSGDVPDNAVFLTYKGASPGFSIQYVEGWQVSPQVDGVVIKDKDSSETVAIVAPQADVPGYISSNDLPGLQSLPGFKLVTQDTVKVGGQRYAHLVFERLSPADPVTGKQVPQSVDRYFVPGPNGLAVVSLATPKGVDNVDAFRQMIESFAWS